MKGAVRHLTIVTYLKLLGNKWIWGCRTPARSNTLVVYTMFTINTSACFTMKATMVQQINLSHPSTSE
eukprot:653221-Amphidinium_carterae.1